MEDIQGLRGEYVEDTQGLQVDVEDIQGLKDGVAKDTQELRGENVEGTQE